MGDFKGFDDDFDEDEEEELLIGSFRKSDNEALNNLDNHELAKYLIKH